MEFDAFNSEVKPLNSIDPKGLARILPVVGGSPRAFELAGIFI